MTGATYAPEGDSFYGSAGSRAAQGRTYGLGTHTYGSLPQVANSASSIANLTSNLFLTKGVGLPTFTRATTAYVQGYLAAANPGDAMVYILCDAGEARFYGMRRISSGVWSQTYSDGVTPLPRAGKGNYLSEGAATNKALWCRDLTNAAWTKLNITPALDQVGIDGVANSASSITATLANGSVLQTITGAATASALGIFIKRITGTGTVTIQQGATTLDVTALINSATYTRVELDATVLNPAIGIVLATSGDKIAVDVVQFENNAFATSPILTTTVAVTRNADVDSYPTAGNILAAAGSIYLEYTPNHIPSGIIALFSTNVDGSNFTDILHDGTQIQFRKYIGGVSYAALSQPNAFVAGTTYKLCVSWGATGISIALNGTLGTPNANTTAAPIAATMQFGAESGSFQPSVQLGNKRIWQTQLPDTTLQALTV